MQLSEQTINRLKKLAESECVGDDEDAVIYDYCGGNVDDAYSSGCHSGEVYLARDILNELGVDWIAPGE